MNHKANDWLSPKILLCFTEDSPKGPHNHRIFILEQPETFQPLLRDKLVSGCLGFRVEVILNNGQSVHYVWTDWTNFIWNVYMVVLCLYLIALNYLHLMVGRTHNLSGWIMKLHGDSLTQGAGRLPSPGLLPAPSHCWVSSVIIAEFKSSPCSGHSPSIFLSLPIFLFLFAYSKMWTFLWVCGRKSDLGSDGFFRRAEDFPGSRLNGNSVGMLTGGLIKLFGDNINYACSRLSWCRKHLAHMELPQKSSVLAYDLSYLQLVKTGAYQNVPSASFTHQRW